jgi:hypothetical protein
VAKSDEEKHRQIIEIYNEWSDAWKEIYEKSKSDVLFAAGANQWDGSTKRGGLKLTYNLVGGAVRYVVNQAKANPPSIEVSPKSGGEKNTAKVIAGYVREIEKRSNSGYVYSEALRHSVCGGIGFFRVLAVDDGQGKGFSELRLRHVKDFSTILPDPHARESDFSDMSGFFVRDRMTKSAFKRRFPKANINSDSFEGASRDWIDDDSVAYCEYWCRENITDDEGNRRRGIKQYLISGREILKVIEWKGALFPLCVIIGEDYQIEKDRVIKGIVRDVKDIQKVINFEKSVITEFLGHSGRGEWIGTPEMFKGVEKFWTGDNFPYKLYNPTSDGGRPVREDPLPPPAGLIAGSEQSANDLRSVIGIRDPLKDVPSSQSGKAIALQLATSDVATYHYIEARDIAVQQAGRIILDMIPHVYNYEHIAEIRGADGTLESVPVNQPFDDHGETVEHDLTKAVYQCSVKSGPSYATAQQQTLEKVLELAQAVPAAAQVGPDIIAGQFDFTGSDEMAARLRATVPPQIVAAGSSSNADKAQNMLGMAQQQAQQAQAENQQLHQILDQMSKELEQMKSGTMAKMQMQESQQAHEKEMASAKLDSDSRLKEMQGQIDMILQEMRGHTTLQAEDIRSQNRMDEVSHQHAEQIGVKVADRLLTPHTPNRTGTNPGMEDRA